MVMRVFVAGGTGVVGRRLVPQLVARGHQVTATTTDPGKLGSLELLGADAVVMDGLDAVSVGRAVEDARPDVIVNQMTAINPVHAGKPDMKHFDRWFAITNRLRTEGTDHLLAAAEASGVSNFVAQSYANWNGIRVYVLFRGEWRLGYDLTSRGIVDGLLIAAVALDPLPPDKVADFFARLLHLLSPLSLGARRPTRGRDRS